MEQSLEDRFTNILANNEQRLYRICRAYARNLEDRQDLFGEVLLNLWKSLPAFRHESQVDTWVYRLNKNAALDQLLPLRKSIDEALAQLEKSD